MVAREDAGIAVDERDRHAEAGVGLRQLRAGGAAAHDDQRARQLARAGALAVVPVVDGVEAHDVRDARVRADGDDDVLAVEDALAAVGEGHAHGAGTVEAGGPPDGLGADIAVALLVARIGRVVDVLAVDHPVAEVGRLGPGVVATGVVHGCRVEERLGGHAGPVGAGPAEEIAVHDRDRAPALTGQLQRGLTGCAGADDDEVEGVLGVGHGVSSSCCSASRKAIMTGSPRSTQMMTSGALRGCDRIQARTVASATAAASGRG